MTAAIPAILAIAPEIINLIASLVHKSAPAQEALGSGTGAVKFANVFSDVITALTKAADTGTIPKALPSDEIIKAIIQAVVTSLQLSGLLGTSATAPATGSAQSITLSAGQSVTITVK